MKKRLSSFKNAINSIRPSEQIMI